MNEASCPRCDAPFKRTNPRKVYCSETCRKRAEKQRNERRKREAMRLERGPRVSTIKLGVCRDCGATENMYWWEGKKGYYKAGATRDQLVTSAATRCRSCYNLYCKYRQVIAGRYIFGPPKPKAVYQPVADFTCTDCGSPFRRKNAGTRCVPCGLARRCHAETLRREAEQAGDKDIHWKSLGERDKWRCHICGDKVPKIPGTATNALGATVDHLVPIHAHGTHTWTNVALAHRTCNVSRGTGGIVQLRLVG